MMLKRNDYRFIRHFLKLAKEILSIILLVLEIVRRISDFLS